MVISYQWLAEYLPEPLSIDELSKILTSIGLEVEAVEPVETIPGSLEGLVIGQVLTCAKHPNADKLSVTTVSFGEGEPVQIVCGAPNVAAGQKVVVAPVGATVHPTEGEPFLIKKAKIRGEESSGMICAEDEIGLGKSHAGIMILPEEAPVGTLAKTYFNIPSADNAIHIGLTPNRSDAMSHIGVAKDVCAYLTHHNGKPYGVRVPAAETAKPGSSSINIKITIGAPDACPRYAGVGVSGVKVGQSPEWLQRRLQAIGLRSINNVVDVTNFVLHEFGQPLHAFDADKIGGKSIHVGFLPAGTVFKALDEKERKLNAADLMINDANGPVAMAGVFGGWGSGVNAETTNIFLESAYFNPGTVRRTSLHYGLRTDAATHFEKGVDINNVIPALKRAAAMICEISGGKIASEIVDVYPAPLKPVTVNVTYDYIQKLSGKEYTPAAIKEVLTALGFVIEEETVDGLLLKVPSNKTDVSQPADIVEEVLRIDGLDNIEIPQRLNISLTRPMQNDRHYRERISSLLCGMGFHEIVTNSIVNSKYYPDNTSLVRMLNSLSSELDVMRPSLLESGLDVVQYNCNRKSQDLCLFELGRVYAQQEGKYIEESQLGIWITGDVQKTNWNQKLVKSGIFYLKGLIDNLVLQSGITGIAVSYTETNGGHTIEWKWKNKTLCRAWPVSSKRLGEFDIKQDVFFAEITWDLWVKASDAVKIKYYEIPKFPAVQRDLAVVLDKNISYQQVEHETGKLKLSALQSFGLFDVFESEKLGADKKSYALSYTFQLQDRTLTDTEIDEAMKQLMTTYKTKLQALIRE